MIKGIWVIGVIGSRGWVHAPRLLGGRLGNDELIGRPGRADFKPAPTARRLIEVVSTGPTDGDLRLRWSIQSAEGR